MRSARRERTASLKTVGHELDGPGNYFGLHEGNFRDRRGVVMRLPKGDQCASDVCLLVAGIVKVGVRRRSRFQRARPQRSAERITHPTAIYPEGISANSRWSSAATPIRIKLARKRDPHWGCEELGVAGVCFAFVDAGQVVEQGFQVHPTIWEDRHWQGINLVGCTWCSAGSRDAPSGGRSCGSRRRGVAGLRFYC